MKSLLITPKDTTEVLFLTALPQRPGIGVDEVSGEGLEDAGLLNILRKVDVSDTVSREEIFRKNPVALMKTPVRFLKPDGCFQFPVETYKVFETL